MREAVACECMRMAGEWDVHSLPFNGYLALMREAQFITKFCPPGRLQVGIGSRACA